MTSGTLFGADSGAVWVTAICLLVFGFVYNKLVEWVNRQGYDEGYTWLMVVIGVSVTIGTAGFTIGWSNVLLLLIYFIASGLFMAGGDIARYVNSRQREDIEKLMDDVDRHVNGGPHDGT